MYDLKAIKRLLLFLRILLIIPSYFIYDLKTIKRLSFIFEKLSDNRGRSLSSNFELL